MCRGGESPKAFITKTLSMGFRLSNERSTLEIGVKM